MKKYVDELFGWLIKDSVMTKPEAIQTIIKQITEKSYNAILAGNPDAYQIIED